jgi:predicted tellurium resistance membrane protein TerC
VAPFTFIVYLVITAPPSKVDEPHDAVSLEIPSTTAAKRVGAPGATFGVCIADAVFALDSVVA